MFNIKGHIKTKTSRLAQAPLRKYYRNSVVLATGGDEGVWIWVGKEGNKDENAKGMQVAKAFCIKGHVEVLVEGVNDGPDAATNFWNHIKSEKGETSRN